MSNRRTAYPSSGYFFTSSRRSGYYPSRRHDPTWHADEDPPSDPSAHVPLRKNGFRRQSFRDSGDGNDDRHIPLHRRPPGHCNHDFRNCAQDTGGGPPKSSGQTGEENLKEGDRQPATPAGQQRSMNTDRDEEIMEILETIDKSGKTFYCRLGDNTDVCNVPSGPVSPCRYPGAHSQHKTKYHTVEWKCVVPGKRDVQEKGEVEPICRRHFVQTYRDALWAQLAEFRRSQANHTEQQDTTQSHPGDSRWHRDPSQEHFGRRRRTPGRVRTAETAHWGPRTPSSHYDRY